MPNLVSGQVEEALKALENRTKEWRGPCTRCVHYSATYTMIGPAKSDRCKNPVARALSFNTVTGFDDRDTLPTCIDMRKPGNICGPDGKLYQQWQEKLSPIWRFFSRLLVGKQT